MLVLQVGLKTSSYIVREGDEYLTACVELATPVDRNVSVTVSTVYTEIAGSKQINSIGLYIEHELVNCATG